MTSSADEGAGRVADGDSPRVIDSHLHFWDPSARDHPWLADEPALHRKFVPSDIDPGGVKIDGAIFVQADCLDDQAEDEVAWVQRLAEQGHPNVGPIVGIVAHAPLEAGSDCAPLVDRYSASPLVVGVRRLLQDEPPGFALQPDFLTGVGMLATHRLTFDVCIRHHQLVEITHLVERCPDVSFVLDHVGKPDVSGGGFEVWASHLSGLAALPNVSCKLSGLGSEASLTARNAEAIGPYLRHAVEVFGPSRCMFGSDWPVSSTAMSYRSWHDLVNASLTTLCPSDMALVMGETAQRVYRPTSTTEG